MLAYRTGGYRKRNGNKVSSVLTGSTVWEFLGIYSGRLNLESDLGRVWHFSAIADVLASAAADAQKREQAQKAEEGI